MSPTPPPHFSLFCSGILTSCSSICRSAHGHSQCSDGTRAQAPASRRPRSAQRAPRSRTCVRRVSWTFSMAYPCRCAMQRSTSSRRARHRTRTASTMPKTWTSSSRAQHRSSAPRRVRRAGRGRNCSRRWQERSQSTSVIGPCSSALPLRGAIARVETSVPSATNYPLKTLLRPQLPPPLQLNPHQQAHPQQGHPNASSAQAQLRDCRHRQIPAS